MFLEEAGEVGEHARGEVALSSSLWLDMDEEMGIAVAKADLRHQVGPVALSCGHISEHFVSDEFDARGLDVGGDFGKEQLQELHEEGLYQFFE